MDEKTTAMSALREEVAFLRRRIGELEGEQAARRLAEAGQPQSRA